MQVVDDITVGLTRLNEVSLLLEPGMAESWTVSDDGLTYTFKVRQGIPWVRWNGSAVEEVLDCSEMFEKWKRNKETDEWRRAKRLKKLMDRSKPWHRSDSEDDT